MRQRIVYRRKQRNASLREQIGTVVNNTHRSALAPSGARGSKMYRAYISTDCRFRVFDSFATRRQSHATAPVPGQFIDVHRLGRLRRPTRVRVPPESCRCAYGQPVRRLVTRPQMLFRVDEALQQPRFETVAGGKVTPYPFNAQAQHSAGKILAVHLLPDEEASHVD